MADMNNQPIYILPEGTNRFLGRDAQRMNILAGKILAETIRTTLGPRGMDKMIVNKLEDVIVTNDGATILDEISIMQPAARMIKEIAKTQDSKVGDGTTSVVIIAGELLKKAEQLLDSGIHATSIVAGYKKALDKSLEILEDISINAKDEKTLKKIASTAMTGKGPEQYKEFLSDIIVKASLQVVENDKVDKAYINIERIPGASLSESTTVDGILLDSTKVSKGMPTEVKNAKIALLKYPFEIKDIETNAKINITDPAQMQAFLDNEEQMLKDMVDKVVSVGANVVFCQKGIDDVAVHYLARNGIMALKRVKNTDMKRLIKATGATVITNIDDLKESDLGEAGRVYENKIGETEMTFVEECKDPKAMSIVLRGSTKYVVEETERALEDALGVINATIEDGKVVTGAGSPEIAISKKLKEYAQTIDGREQLAVIAFAEALEIIPVTLAENAGLDSLDILVDLRAAHEKSPYMGVNVYTAEIMDMKKEGVVEPQRVKKQAIQSATEAIEMILRIDDMIAAKGALEASGEVDDMMAQEGGMPQGMGGMPPMGM